MEAQLATLQKREIAPILSKSEMQIVRATIEETASSLAAKSLRVLEIKFVDIISAVFYSLGRDVDDNDLSKLAELLSAEVCKSEFSNLTVSEIRIALENGIRKDYGDYFGVNIVAFNQFLRGYISDQKRIEAIKKQQDWEDQQKQPEITAKFLEQIKEKFWQNENARLLKYQETGELDIPFPIFHYKEYESAGKIHHTSDEKWQLFYNAIERYRDKLLKQLDAPLASKELRYRNREILDRIKENKLTEADKLEIKSIGCLIALEEWFFNQTA